MSETPSPPRRPRLSLQIKAISAAPSVRTSRTLAATVDPSSPTSFNTLSNVYVSAIDRATPIHRQDPPTAIRVKSSLRSPYVGPYLDTPLTAQPASPMGGVGFGFPSSVTATPPLSAGAVETGSRVFTFSVADTEAFGAGRAAPPSPLTPHRQPAVPYSMAKPPYTHPRTLHSILRNSPLPPLSSRSPHSPSRRSLRLRERAAKKVAYNSPIEQTITTNQYVKSHIDLLSEEGSPLSPYDMDEDPEMTLDQAMAYTGNETRDGGETPGPFEEMRRRMAGLGTSAPLSPVGGGVKKRRRREKKRRWVWTIGRDGEEEEAAPPRAGERTGAAEPAVKPVVPVLAVPAPRARPRRAATQPPLLLAIPAPAPAPVEQVPCPAADPAEPPTPSVESDPCQDSVFGTPPNDVEMSDVSSPPCEADDAATADRHPDPDTATPVAAAGARRGEAGASASGDDSLQGPEKHRDTPIPPDLVVVNARWPDTVHGSAVERPDGA